LSPSGDSDPTEKPFQLKKKKSAGEISKKYAKAFSGGTQRGLARARRRGLVSHFALEMGSNFVVKLSHFRTFFMLK